MNAAVGDRLDATLRRIGLDGGKRPATPPEWSRTLDLGCGPNKMHPDAIGIDILNYEGVDIVHDLETGLPFEDDSMAYVGAWSILEHIDDLPGLMAEIHRVLKPGGVLEGQVPHWCQRSAYIDPTHVQYLDPDSFAFWDPTDDRYPTYFDEHFHVRKSRRVRRVQFWRSRPIRFELEAVKR